MGKWSIYRGLEGKYLVHPSSPEVKKLKKYLFQDFYLDFNDKKVYIEDLNNVFDNEAEAKALSSKLLAAKQTAYNEELKLRKKKEEEKKAHQKQDSYLDNLSYSERRYYLD